MIYAPDDCLIAHEGALEVEQMYPAMYIDYNIPLTKAPKSIHDFFWHYDGRKDRIALYAQAWAPSEQLLIQTIGNNARLGMRYFVFAVTTFDAKGVQSVERYYSADGEKGCKIPFFHNKEPYAIDVHEIANRWKY